MSPITTEFENFEHQFTDIIGELQSIIRTEGQLREEVRSEGARADFAEAALAAAKREAAECLANASAAAAGASQATTTLVAVQDELSTTKTKVELSERQRHILEEKCSELTETVSLLQREIDQLRTLQAMQASLQRQYEELETRVRTTAEEARRESSRLEGELRRVERCARGGSEVRERARLAAAAHARERRRAAEEAQRATVDLRNANAEIARLGSSVSELQHRLSEINMKPSVCAISNDQDCITELRATLDAERAGAAKVEKALAAALADNAILAAQLHNIDNPKCSQISPVKEKNIATDISQIDSFLAD